MSTVRLADVRRVLSLALLIVTPAWQLEAVAGLARDGVVHHEPASAAAQHTGTPTGDHGHEDGLPPSQHQHGPQHRHGTPADHCTHAHGFAFMPVFAVGFSAPVVTQDPSEPVAHIDWSAAAESPPPRG